MLRITLSRWQAVFHWDTLIAVSVSVVVGLLPDYSASEWLHSRLIGIEVAASSALLGIVLAGIAITLAIMRDDLLIFLDRQGHGVREEVWPFWFTAALAMLCIFSGILSIALFSHGNTHIIAVRVSIAIVTFFAAWAVLSILSLVDLLARYARIKVLHHESIGNEKLSQESECCRSGVHESACAPTEGASGVQTSDGDSTSQAAT